MKQINLGLNVDHIATLRNARGEGDPSLLEIVFEGIEGGLDSITMHLREDRRHIVDADLSEIQKHVKLPLNMEMALTPEMVEIAFQLRPRSVCIVPEKREELTTEGGLDVQRIYSSLKDHMQGFHERDIEVFLFIEPELSALKLSYDLGAKGVELHTGTYARAFFHAQEKERELHRLKEAANFASDVGLELHAGHGLNYHNVSEMKDLPELTEVNIGHAIISRSLKTGMKQAVREMKELL